VPDGPYVQIATFCRKTTRSKTGNLNVLDCVAAVFAPTPPGQAPPGVVATVSIDELTLALSLWAGDLEGEYAVTIRPEPPIQDVAEVTLNASFAASDSNGQDFAVRFGGARVVAGSYWFRVSISGGPENEADRPVVSIPLDVHIGPPQRVLKAS
jgi:hypothetical protein